MADTSTSFLARPDSSASTAAAVSTPRDSLLQALFDYGLQFGETRADIAGHLGPPSTTESRTTENPYSSTTDTVVRVQYPGLLFGLMRLGADGREFLGTTELTSSGRVLPGGIRSGVTTRQGLVGLLGAPHHTHSVGDSLVMSYPRPSPGAEEFVQFYVLEDTIRKVRWALYVD